LSRCFELKYKSNYINLAAEISRNFYFQKQNYKLLSLNNKHIGAKWNRDQTIIKTIQKILLKMLLKKEKTIKSFTVQVAQRQKRPVTRRARPSARQPTGGPPSRPIALARLGLIRPRTPRSSHSRRIRSDGRPPLPRDQNPRRRRSPSNPRSFSPLLSPRERRQPRSGGDGQAERAGRRRRGLLAGARARQRVSAPPSSRPWTEPRFRAPHTRPRCPGAASRRLHCAAKSGERRRRCVTRTGDGVARGPGKSRTL